MSNYKLVLVFTLLSFIISNSFSQPLLTPRLSKEKKEFIDSQINSADKDFLKKTADIFIDLQKLNEKSITIFESTYLPRKKTYHVITKHLRNSALNALKLLDRKQNPVSNIEVFIDSFLGSESILKAKLQGIVDNYLKSQRIKEYINPGLTVNSTAEGAYHYYGKCLESLQEEFGSPLAELLKKYTLKYQDLASLSQSHQISELKRRIYFDINYLGKVSQYLESMLIQKMELFNRDWAKIVILHTIELIQQQLKFNNDFLLALSEKLEGLAVPSEPDLPDFIIENIEIIPPPKVKVGRKVTLIILIKNTGHLTADPSEIKVIFPNGKIKRKAIPKLSSKESYTLKWHYKLRHSGKNTFEAIANHNNKAWEQDTTNNNTKRALILIE
ncbi:MAG: hypothetical protein KBB01_06185 [Candidatus Omnitrophica bacterium]|jgi:hypothetical protein|nr:hypothetical protein [Candidatus Omnitrophota bacterium]